MKPMSLLQQRSFRSRILSRFVGDTRAAALVEFAIVASLLLCLVFGMVDYGRYFLMRTNLTNAVRDGARYGATLSTASADTVLMRTYTRGLIAGNSTAQGLGTLAVTFPGTVNVDQRVRITLTGYPFNPATFLVIKTAKTITVQAEFRREVPP